MAGYFTQKRYLRSLPTIKWESRHPSETYAGTTYSPRNGTDDFLRVFTPEYQETTSYRSGGTWDVLHPTEPEQASGALGRDTYRDLVDPPVRIQHDTGHTFHSVRQESWISHPNFSLTNPAWAGWSYKGPILPYRTGLPIPSGSWHRAPSGLDLEALGRKAIQDTIPTNPGANLATLLGELRESVPQIPLAQLIRGQGRAANTIGSEFLNIEFGWKPLISDIEKLCLAVKNHNLILRQYMRDSGRQVRRKRSYPVQTELHSFNQYPAQPVWVPGRDPSGLRSRLFKSGDGVSAPGYGTFSQTDQTEHYVWFSGAYTYHLEEGSAFLERMERYEQLSNKLLGSRLTPEVIWELTPWSWLTDWLGDLGVSISNASALATDGLVLRYGYLMCKSIRTLSLAQTGLAPQRGTLGPVQAIFSTVEKTRIRSTPFGFGLSTDDFTLRQWAILAALGLTKAPNTLR